MMGKKVAFFTVLVMLLGLTACSGTKNVSSLQEERGKQAVELSTKVVVPYMAEFFEKEKADERVSQYNVHELKEVTGKELSGIEVDGNGIKNGIISFRDSAASLGEVQNLDALEGEYVISGNNIIVTVPLTGSRETQNGVRTAKVEVIFSNDIFLTLKSCTLNLDQSVSELMGKAASDTLMGMGTVFLVLILISVIISALGVIPKLMSPKKAEPVAKKEQHDESPVFEQIIEKETQESRQNEEQEELAAVIAAAIAAYQYNNKTDGFVVRSIRKRR